MRDKAPEKMGTVVPLFEAVPYEKSMARLTRTTAGMESAVMEQKETVAAFRSTMAELRDKTEQLDESCQLLHQTVERINVSVTQPAGVTSVSSSPGAATLKPFTCTKPCCGIVAGAG